MGATKVDREGVITHDGKNVGYVKKEMRQGIFSTMLGVSASSGGTPYWVPFAADGTCLNEAGYDTRKRAVARVVAHAEPLTVTDLRLEQGLGSSAQCATAGVKFQGHYFGVSRYAGESAWVIDYYSSADSICPVWSNGTGTRYTSARGLTPDVGDAVTAAAEAAGIWPIPS